MMDYWVYVLENENGRWYIGQTSNPKIRLNKHNSQKVKSTKNRGVWKLIYKEKFTNRSSAMRKEKYLKSGYGRRFLKNFLGKG